MGQAQCRADTVRFCFFEAPGGVRPTEMMECRGWGQGLGEGPGQT